MRAPILDIDIIKMKILLVKVIKMLTWWLAKYAIEFVKNTLLCLQYMASNLVVSNLFWNYFRYRESWAINLSIVQFDYAKETYVMINKQKQTSQALFLFFFYSILIQSVTMFLVFAILIKNLIILFLLFHSVSIEGTCNFDFKDLWLFFLLIRAFKNLDELCSLFKSTIVDPVLKPQSTSSAQTSTNTDRVRSQRSRLEDEDPLRVPPRRPPYRDTGGWYVRL